MLMRANQNYIKQKDFMKKYSVRSKTLDFLDFPAVMSYWCSLVFPRLSSISLVKKQEKPGAGPLLHVSYSEFGVHGMENENLFLKFHLQKIDVNKST